MDTGTAIGREPLNIPTLPDSAPLLDRPEELRARWARDGVLYFRQVVDQEAIAKVRDAYLSQLKALGVVAADATQPVWTGSTHVDGKAARKIDDAVWQALVTHPSFDRVIRQFLGEAPSWIPMAVHRVSPPSAWPEDGDVFSKRHQDGPFNYGLQFATCWVPLMDLPPALGGLAVAPGSHSKAHHTRSAQAMDIYGPIPAEALPPEQWRRPDYKAGDILMFHNMTAHAGLPNTSDQIRLSIDVRYIPASLPKPIEGVIEAFEGDVVTMKDISGTPLSFKVNDDTVVRGPKGFSIHGDERKAILFSGANVLAVPDTQGEIKLVRSVSRKYLDLPQAWLSELPPGWVS